MSDVLPSLADLLHRFLRAHWRVDVDVAAGVLMVHRESQRYAFHLYELGFRVDFREGAVLMVWNELTQRQEGEFPLEDERSICAVVRCLCRLTRCEVPSFETFDAVQARASTDG